VIGTSTAFIVDAGGEAAGADRSASLLPEHAIAPAAIANNHLLDKAIGRDRAP
jgi:hypothetical protein